MRQLQRMKDKYEGLEFVNGNNEPYVVIRYYDARTVEVLFPETSTTRLAAMNAILLGNVKNPIHGNKNPHLIKNKIGEKRENGIGLEMIVIDQIAEKVKIEFVESGYKIWKRTDDFNKGDVKDVMDKSVYGIGYLGNHDNKDMMHKKAYGTWKEMLRRCYTDKYIEENVTCYFNVTVDESWHCYATFQKDIKDLEGYSNWCDNQNWDLDKDFKSGETKIYSKFTCVFISHSNNVSLRKVGVLSH